MPKKQVEPEEPVVEEPESESQPGLPLRKMREAMTLVDGNEERAVELFLGWMDDDHELFRATMLPMRRIVAKGLAHRIRMQIRRDLWEKTDVEPVVEPPPLVAEPLDPAQRAQEARETLTAMSQFGEQHLELQGLQAWPLKGGLKLGYATRLDLREVIRHYDAQATTMRGIARWLKKIEARLPNDEVRVAAVLKNDQLQRLKLQAKREVEEQVALEA